MKTDFGDYLGLPKVIISELFLVWLNNFAFFKAEI